MIIAVFSVPAILALTLTLPVVDDGRAGEGGVALPVGQDEPLLDHEQNRLGAEGDDGHHGEEGDPLLTSEVGEDLHFLVEAGFSPLHSPLGRIHHHSYRRTSPNLEAAMHADVDLGLEEDASKEMLEEEEEEALKFHPVLAAVHCVFGPTFCSYIVFSEFSVPAPVKFDADSMQVEQRMDGGSSSLRL
jgi:sodium/potassium/calcium exchanger 6